jgi:rubredoxin
MTSQRYAVFQKSTTCPVCGLSAQYFAIERNYKLDEKTDGTYEENYHLNLYGINDDDEEILFTKDHIIAKANGGKNKLDNYVTMCTVCNWEKGSNNG